MTPEHLAAIRAELAEEVPTDATIGDWAELAGRRRAIAFLLLDEIAQTHETADHERARAGSGRALQRDYIESLEHRLAAADAALSRVRRLVGFEYVSGPDLHAAIEGPVRG